MERFIAENEIIQDNPEEETNKFGLIPAINPSQPEEAIDPDFIYQSDDITSEDDDVHDIASSEYDDDYSVQVPTRDAFISSAVTKSNIFNFCMILGYMLNILLFDIIEYNIFYTYKLMVKILVLVLFSTDLLLLESKFARVSCLILAFSLSMALAI